MKKCSAFEGCKSQVVAVHRQLQEVRHVEFKHGTVAKVPIFPPQVQVLLLNFQ
jgi:hypothetical protein